MELLVALVGHLGNCVSMFHCMLCLCVFPNALSRGFIGFECSVAILQANSESSFRAQACAEHMRVWDPLVVGRSVMVLSCARLCHVCSELCRSLSRCDKVVECEQPCHERSELCRAKQRPDLHSSTAAGGHINISL